MLRNSTIRGKQLIPTFHLHLCETKESKHSRHEDRSHLICRSNLFSALDSSQAGGARWRRCRRAYRQCEFRFKGYSSLPIFKIDGTADVAFTSRIISKHHGEWLGYVNMTDKLGVLNTNNIEPEFILRRRTIPISSRGHPAFTPTHFKPFPIPHTRGSGVGHQTFHGNQLRVARGKCIRVFFTHYQVLNSDGTVKKNFNDVPRHKNKCVVFRTRGGY